jgi:hypothetical protein
MAKRTPKSSRSAGAGRTSTTTVEPSAPPDAAPPTEWEQPAAPVAAPQTTFEPAATDDSVPLTAPDPFAADVSVPLTALDPPAPPAAAPRNALVETAAKSPPQPPSLAGGTLDVDGTIGQLTRLYRAITGRDVPLSSTPYAPIPANSAPVQHVEEQLARLIDVLASTRTMLLRLAR